MEERVQTLEQGARRGVLHTDHQEQEVLLMHSQVRRIKREDEEDREHLLKLQLLETMPAGGFRGPAASPRASCSLSPLRRAGSATPPASCSLSPLRRAGSATPPASCSLSPLRRAGSAIPVGD